MYGTQLYKALQVKSPYRERARCRIKDFDAIENEDFEGAKILAPSGQAKKTT